MSKFFALIRQSIMGSSAAQSGNVARERLSVMLVHQRNVQMLSAVDMESLQRELTDVVQKYIKVANMKPVSYSMKQEGGLDMLEIHFPIEAAKHFPQVEATSSRTSTQDA